jgi:hypothetical protein
MAFGGSVASLVGLVWSFFVYYKTPLGEPIIEITFRSSARVFIRNIGIGIARDVQFYPALYSITEEGHIHDRFIPSQPILHLDELAPNKEFEVSRSNYIEITYFSQVKYPKSGYQGPFLVVVVISNVRLRICM